MDAGSARRRARVPRRPAADSVPVLSAAEPPSSFDEGASPAPLEAGPAIARLAIGAWARSAGWTLSTAVRASRRLGEAAVSGTSPVELLDEARDELATTARTFLGIGDDTPPASPGGAGKPRSSAAEGRAESLRRRGEALLERAARVEDTDEGIHPGFDRIVDQLSPDEARILQLLNGEGAQAIVYVHKAAPLGIGAREVARRLSLIGREAGCLHPELVPAYIDNLVRLGLVAIRRDPVPGEDPYQVLEAQPEVTEALRSANGTIFRGTTTRRSVHLSDFGCAFCAACFPAPAEGGAVLATEPRREAPEERELDTPEG